MRKSRVSHSVNSFVTISLSKCAMAVEDECFVGEFQRCQIIEAEQYALMYGCDAMSFCRFAVGNVVERPTI